MYALMDAFLEETIPQETVTYGTVPWYSILIFRFRLRYRFTENTQVEIFHE